MKGGKREGAGRKPLPPTERKVQLTVTIEQITDRKIRSLAKSRQVSLGRVVDEVIQEF